MNKQICRRPPNHRLIAPRIKAELAWSQRRIRLESGRRGMTLAPAQTQYTVYTSTGMEHVL
jgi:hypothetical protein